VDAGLVSEYPLIGPDLVRLGLGAGDLTRVQDVVTKVQELAAAHPDASPAVGAALRCRGLLENDPRTLMRAVEVLRGRTRPLELALACEDAGEALARAGRHAEARERFEEAFSLYHQLEADRETMRADARLRDLHLRRGRRGHRSRPSHGWESLTETERKVVSLVAQGASNPEVAERLFMSRATVKTHVSHALSKLGLASRVELAAAAARRAG
jgi:DNA-binding CsgD family transcriptional regulator